MDACIFCAITQKKIPTQFIAENDDAVVFADRSPRAPIHYLIVPKKHIVNIKDLSSRDQSITWAMLKLAQEIGRTKGIDFNLVSNNGAQAGQVVFHMHWHFMSGRSIDITE